MSLRPGGECELSLLINCSSQTDHFEPSLAWLVILRPQLHQLEFATPVKRFLRALAWWQLVHCAGQERLNHLVREVVWGLEFVLLICPVENHVCRPLVSQLQTCTSAFLIVLGSPKHKQRAVALREIGVGLSSNG
jgi:hypothetical protein